MSEIIKHVHEFDLERQTDAVIVSSERITAMDADAEVREITLDVQRSNFEIEVGQSIAVIAPGTPELGNAQHVRLYSVADIPEKSPEGKTRLRICVRRVNYLDEYSGEQYPGQASNYLCDLKPGDPLPIAGPFGIAFSLPEESDATLILIGTGTGIAPFRAFVKKLYREGSNFTGQVYLFHGAQSGIEMIYMNDEKNDFINYYDEETFKAFEALSPRPNWADPIAWDFAIGERGDEILVMLDDPKTYVYVAGLEKMRPELDTVFSGLIGGADKWADQKAELMAAGRWVELLY